MTKRQHTRVVSFMLMVGLFSFTPIATAQDVTTPPPPPPGVADEGAADEAPLSSSSTADPESAESQMVEREEIDPKEWLKNDEEESHGNTVDPQQTFGIALSMLDVKPNWSALGDVTFTAAPEGPVTFDSYHFNIIMGATMAEHFHAELELEIEHGGEEMGLEYAIFDWSPARWFAIRSGKMLVPFGRFNDLQHPSFLWNQASKPAMFRVVPPATWSDVGLQFMGKIDIGTFMVLGYNLYTVNGFARPEDVDLTQKAEPVRAMRNGFLDNNSDKGVGARLFSHFVFADGLFNFSLYLSGYSGAVDTANQERLSMLDAAAEFGVGDFMVRGEAAQSLLGVGNKFTTLYERGAYLQLSYRVMDFTLTSRWDYTFLRPGMGSPDYRNQFVPGVMFKPNTFMSVRADLILPFEHDWNLDNPSLLLMLAFNF